MFAVPAHVIAYARGLTPLNFGLLGASTLVALAPLTVAFRVRVIRVSPSTPTLPCMNVIPLILKSFPCKILEARGIVNKCELRRANRTLFVLRDNHLSDAGVLLRLLVHLLTEQ